jgi:hypothetical protein
MVKVGLTVLSNNTKPFEGIADHNLVSGNQRDDIFVANIIQ